MPFSGLPLGPAEMSTQAGSFFGSVVYVPEADFARSGAANSDFPSAVNVQVVPAGGSSRFPSATAVSTAHSPTRPVEEEHPADSRVRPATTDRQRWIARIARVCPAGRAGA